MKLILPGHPQFKATLVDAPKWWRIVAADDAEPGYLIADKYGVFHRRNAREYLDFALGGGYEDEFEPPEDEFESPEDEYDEYF